MLVLITIGSLLVYLSVGVLCYFIFLKIILKMIFKEVSEQYSDLTINKKLVKAQKIFDKRINDNEYPPILLWIIFWPIISIIMIIIGTIRIFDNSIPDIISNSFVNNYKKEHPHEFI